MIKRKSEIASILKDFKVWAENHFREKVGEVRILSGLRSDNESVNVCKEVREWCTGEGIGLSTAYEQWQNGVVERGMRTVWEGSEAMRKNSGAPECFWPHTVESFVHVFNRMALGESERSPHEMWHDVDIFLGKRIAHLRTWGCKAYAFVPKVLSSRVFPFPLLTSSHIIKSMLIPKA